MEPDCDGVPVYASNTTGEGQWVTVDGKKECFFFAVTDIHFGSSPLMVQLLFFGGEA
jgi:hypothetical protein